jgi:hypothetical protein
VFVLNKGFSMAAALCFVLGYRELYRQSKGTPLWWHPSIWFRAGAFGAVVHIPMSLAILRPSYFKEFFSGERLSLNGEVVFLCGALTAGGVYLLSKSQWSSRERWLLSLATMTTLALHTLFMGLARGLHLNYSHAYLPPMWLISLVAVGLGTWFAFRCPRTDRQNEGSQS